MFFCACAMFEVVPTDFQVVPTAPFISSTLHPQTGCCNTQKVMLQSDSKDKISTIMAKNATKLIND